VARLEGVIRRCGNLKEFGRALHTFQDTYSHSGAASTPNGHLVQSFLSLIGLARDPDKFGDDPGDAKMEKESKEWLRKLKKHRATHPEAPIPPTEPPGVSIPMDKDSMTAGAEGRTGTPLGRSHAMDPSMQPRQPELKTAPPAPQEELKPAPR
jgi:hypothetical protein